MKQVTPYSALATVYDAVMAHVDYEAWADFLLHIVEMSLVELAGAQKPVAGGKELEDLRVLEMAAGTGLMTEELLEQSGWRIAVTDGSADMLARARQRLQPFQDRCSFEELDYSSEWSSNAAPFDLQVLLYDGLNYLLTTDEVDLLMHGVRGAASEGGLFVFDQSTPHNSINNAEFFEDEGEEDGIRYHRRSHFDLALGIHTTEFDIEGPNGRFSEVHRQRAWTRSQILELLERHRFEVIHAFDGFSLDPAHDKSERIHWVVRPTS